MSQLLYRDHRQLTPDELDRIIYQVLRKEYPKKVRRIVHYIMDSSEQIGVFVDNPQSLSVIIIKRLQLLEAEKRVEWTRYGWKLR